MAEVLIDTDVLIDVARGIPEAVAFLDAAVRESAAAISSITAMELLAGCRNKQESRQVARLLKRIQVIKLSESVTDIAMRLMTRYSLSHGLKIPDALIAATALHERAALATRNQRDYVFIRGLRLAAYP